MLSFFTLKITESLSIFCRPYSQISPPKAFIHLFIHSLTHSFCVKPVQVVTHPLKCISKCSNALLALYLLEFNFSEGTNPCSCSYILHILCECGIVHLNFLLQFERKQAINYLTTEMA